MSETGLSHEASAHAELPPGHFHHMEPEQAYHSAKLGMWIFLATEVHLFGGLFCLFAIFRWQYLHEFNEHARDLNWMLGGLNTLVLLTSSYFMVRAVDAAQKGLNYKVRRHLEKTMFCGLIFMVVKYFEWTHKLCAILPWTQKPCQVPEAILPQTHIFYGLYYTMTGLHGVHVLVGLGLMVWLWLLARKDRFGVTYYTPVEVVGLYWHLVDVVWIYLFPLFYLLGGVKFPWQH